MHSLTRLLLATLAVFCFNAATPAALPTEPHENHDDFLDEIGNGIHPFADYPPIPKVEARQENRVALRIMPLGASIMSGVGSPEHSGLRKWLRAALRFDGWDVNMVGSYQHGTDMTDKDHEAVPGDLLSQIATRLNKTSDGYKPNILIINGGTNNANGATTLAKTRELVEKAGETMLNMLNQMWAHEDTANTCVILSTLLPTTHPVGVVHRITINAMFRNIVQDLSKERCIYLADMEPSGNGRDFIDINGPYWSDNPKIHPNNEGHRRMAYVFYAAINRALKADKVKEAPPKASEPNTGCDKVYWNGISAGADTQNGWGVDDGIYHHDSREVPEVKLEWPTPNDTHAFRLARLFTRDYDDVLQWYGDDVDNRFRVWKNSGDGQGKFSQLSQHDLNPDLYCIPRGVHFIDMNGDGLDDIVCVNLDGEIFLSINQGDGTSVAPPTFKRVSDTARIRSTGAAQDRIRLADIDGDGRGDIGIIADDASVRFWRNGGVGDFPEYWQDLGVRSKLKPGASGKDALNGIRFADVNGDGRDDWLWMDKKGVTTTWTNTRSCAAGKIGNGLHVSWRQGFHKGSNSGPSHFGFGSPGHGNPDLRKQVFFGRIFGTKPAFGNLGVLDYVYFEIEETDIPLVGPYVTAVKMRVFKNLGSGGTKVWADGNKYCNMVGNEKGRMDYVWTWSTGKMRLYPNGGKDFISPGESYWKKTPGDIWTPPVNMDRRDLHLSDWDGDGVCDIVWVNPDNGNLRVFINDYPTKKTWDGAFREIQAPAVSCNQHRGIGINDLAVRFADITGNGRSDYLCIEPNGRVSGYVQHDDGKMEAIPQIKFAEEYKDRANLRWADVNGDGKDDMLWVDKFTGDAFVWYNEGRTDDIDANLGSYFHWRKIDSAVYRGDVAGQCMYYPDLDGNGRADQHSIHGTWTNKATTAYNPSCGLEDVMGDDPEGVYDPQLPVQIDNPSDGSDGPSTPGSPGDTPDPGDGDDQVCQNLDDNPWRHVDCTSPFIESDTHYTEAEKWNGLGCPDAWLSAVAFQRCIVDHHFDNLGYGFSAIISDFFDTPMGMNCQLFGGIDGCNAANKIGCEDSREPAGYYIYNSLAVLHTLFLDYYDAIGDAVNFASYNGIAEDFGSLPKDTDFPAILNIILDIVTLGYGLAAAPSWNLIVLNRFEGAGINAVKDAINDFVYNGATLAKDVVAKVLGSDDPTALKLDKIVHSMGQAWRKAVMETNAMIFDGSDHSKYLLTELLAEGKMLNRQLAVNESKGELQQIIGDTLSALTIPLAWAASPDKLYPVIIREDFDCEHDPRSGWQHQSIPYIDRDAYKKRYCNEAVGFKSHWLLSPYNPKSTCELGKFPDYKPICYEYPLAPGFKQLEEKEYGISLDDVILGSINTWEAAGRKNGNVMPALTVDFLQILPEKGLQTAGVFNIPVCSMEEVHTNWQWSFTRSEDELWAGFPCNKP